MSEGLEALCADPTIGLPRDIVEGFITGKIAGPVLIVESDDHARVAEYFGRCLRDGMTVRVEDRSTLWDRLRDRLDGRPAPPALEAPQSVDDDTDAPRFEAPPETSVRRADDGALTVPPPLRVAGIAALGFAAALGVVYVVVPEFDGVDDEAPAAQRADAGGVGAGPAGSRAMRGGGGGAEHGLAPDASLLRGRAAGTLAGAAPGGGAVVDLDDTTKPDAPRAPRASLVEVLGAWALGFAVAWGGGGLAARQATKRPRAARGAWGALLASAMLSVAALVWLRVTPHPEPVAAPSTSAAITGDAGGATSATGVFASFLRRQRGRGVAPRTPSFASLLEGYRARRGDAGSPQAVAVELPDASGVALRDEPRRRHRRHRHAASRRTAAVADASTAAVGGAPEVLVDAAVRAEVGDDAGRAPTMRVAVGARGDAGGAAVSAVVEAAPPPPPPRVAPRPRPRRAPMHRGTAVAFVLGVIVGLLASPRWRAVARGGAA